MVLVSDNRQKGYCESAFEEPTGDEKCEDE